MRCAIRRIAKKEGCESAKPETIKELLPDNAVLGVINMFLTPRRSFKDGTSLKPVQLDNDEVSEALSDLTTTQLVKKRPPKKLKRVFHAANESQGTVMEKKTTSQPNITAR
jgi:hypothetical protein